MNTTVMDTVTLPVEDILTKFETSPSGLTAAEVTERLEKYGPNEILQRKKQLAVIDFLLHFKSPLVLILLVAGTLSGIFGSPVSMYIIFAIISLSVVLDYYQEAKAGHAAELLKEKVSTTATVIRDGQKQETKLPDIVLGDIVVLSAGDIVPADSRLLDAKDLFIDQSSLTGESFPVEKEAVVAQGESELVTENKNMVFMGTSVISGNANAVVMGTGSNTELGRIAQHLVAKESETEFERSSRNLGMLIVEVTLVLVIFIFFVLALVDHDILESFLFSVALAVGLTPELLPMIITINLSKGALNMARKGVIVKKLSSIQNFGNMDVLCTDKTGTLTENKISLASHIDLEGNELDKVIQYGYLNSFYQTGLKSPLDDAVLKHEEIDIHEFVKVDEIPFDFNRKRVSIVVSNGEDHVLITKGAPEEIIKVCSRSEAGKNVYSLTPETRKKIQYKFNELSSQGFRVLGVAYKTFPLKDRTYKIEDESAMTFLGFLAFLDPPKASAKESLLLLKNAGIDVKIVTGDNDLVARKVCEELGFEIKGVLIGSQILYMHDDALQRAVEKANLFARVTPGQKSRILNALKANGHVVGFLGDGINDATSIKNADVGISVDNAVDVAKESADFILLEKGLNVLHAGVLEGRKTFSNTLKYLLMGTSSNFGNMFSVAAAAIFLPFLPMSPIQILLNNMLYDLSETTIPTDNVDAAAIAKPRKLDISYVRRFMVLLGPISSIFDILTFLIMIFIIIRASPFAISKSPYDIALFQTAWFIESMATQTLVVFILRTNENLLKSRPSWPLAASTIAIVVVAVVIPYTPLGPLFQFVWPPWQFFVFVALATAAYLGLVAFVKGRFHKKYGSLLEHTFQQVKTRSSKAKAF